MAEKDSYQKLIDHHKKWIFGSPGPELLHELFETIFTPDEAEFLSKIPFIPYKANYLSKKLKITIEELVEKNTQLLRESISIRKEQQFIIDNGITGYNNKILNEYKLKEKACPKEQIYSVIRQDKSLRFPHRKILNYLTEQYDYHKSEFTEVHFSKIVKECRL